MLANDHFPREIVTVSKANGTLLEGVEARIYRDDRGCQKIMLFDGMLDVQEGDVVLRTIANQSVERYIILDTGFRQTSSFRDAHYQMFVRKETSISMSEYSQIVNNFHVNGPNSRVNYHSSDSSNNYAGSACYSDVFAQARELLDRVESPAQREEIGIAIADMEHAISTPNFAVKYSRFIGSVADNVTVFMPVIQALAQLMCGTHG